MKKLLIPLFIFLILLFFGCSKSDEEFITEYEFENLLIAGSGATSFQRVLKGNGSGYRNSVHLSSVKETPGGGYIICGTLWDEIPKLLLIKTNHEGETLWVQTLGSEFGGSGEKIEISEDNNFIVSGWFATEPWNGFGDYNSNHVIIKFNDNGEQLWQESFDLNGHVIFVDGCCTEDNGYIVLFFEYEDPYEHTGINQSFLIKVDENGEEKWRKTLGSSRLNNIENDENDGFLLGGSESILKIDSMGDIIWSTDLIGSYIEQFRIFQDGFILNGGSHIFKLDNTGNEVWSKAYNIESFEEPGYPTHYGTDYELYDLTVSGDNNFMVIGGYQGYHLDKDIGFWRAHLFKVSSVNGEILWIRSLNPEEGNRLLEIQKCEDHGCIIVGETADYDNEFGSNSSSWGYFIKTDENGN